MGRGEKEAFRVAQGDDVSQGMAGPAARLGNCQSATAGTILDRLRSTARTAPIGEIAGLVGFGD